MSKPGQVWIGTSGWIYPHWRGLFYPTSLPVRQWLPFYQEHFDTVEINNTFYRLPEEHVFAEWKQRAGPGFLYAVKASRFLTHRKKLKEAAEPLERMLGRARLLGQHLGPVLYQLPPRWHANVDRLREFIALLPADRTHVFEFRDPTWYNDEVRQLLTTTGMSFCIHDFRGFSCPVWLTGPAVYLRFHGSTAAPYTGGYSRPHLRRWAEKIQDFRQTGRDVYVYFNNDVGGHAVADARALQALLKVGPGEG